VVDGALHPWCPHSQLALGTDEKTRPGNVERRVHHHSDNYLGHKEHIALIRHENKLDWKNYNRIVICMVHNMNVPVACLLLVAVVAMVVARATYRTPQWNKEDPPFPLDPKEGKGLEVVPVLVVAFAQSQPSVLS